MFITKTNKWLQSLYIELGIILLILISLVLFVAIVIIGKKICSKIKNDLTVELQTFLVFLVLFTILFTAIFFSVKGLSSPASDLQRDLYFMILNVAIFYLWLICYFCIKEQKPLENNNDNARPRSTMLFLNLIYMLLAFAPAFVFTTIFIIFSLWLIK